VCVLCRFPNVYIPATCPDPVNMLTRLRELYPRSHVQLRFVPSSQVLALRRKSGMTEDIYITDVDN